MDLARSLDAAKNAVSDQAELRFLHVHPFDRSPEAESACQERIKLLEYVYSQDRPKYEVRCASDPVWVQLAINCLYTMTAACIACYPLHHATMHVQVGTHMGDAEMKGLPGKFSFATDWFTQ